MRIKIINSVIQRTCMHRLQVIGELHALCLKGPTHAISCIAIYRWSVDCMNSANVHIIWAILCILNGNRAGKMSAWHETSIWRVLCDVPSGHDVQGRRTRCLPGICCSPCVTAAPCAVLASLERLLSTVQLDPRGDRWGEGRWGGEILTSGNIFLQYLGNISSSMLRMFSDLHFWSNCTVYVLNYHIIYPIQAMSFHK